MKQITMAEILKLNDEADVKLDYFENSQEEMFYNITKAKEIKKAFKYMKENDKHGYTCYFFMKNSDGIDIKEFFDNFDKFNTALNLLKQKQKLLMSQSMIILLTLKHCMMKIK